MKKAPKKKPPSKKTADEKPARHDFPWADWEDEKVRAGINCGWRDGSQQALADELERKRVAVQQRSHKLQNQKPLKPAAKRKPRKKRSRR